MRLVVSLSALLAFGCDDPSPPKAVEKPAEKAAEPELAPPAEFDACKGDDCLTVPEGIIGTVFGMTLEAAKTRFGRLRSRTRSKRHVKIRPDCSERRRPPEKRYIGKTTLGDEPAQCELDFVDDVGLVRIACTLHGKRDRTEHAETANVLFASLTKQYGTPAGTAEHLLNNGVLSAKWESAAATLEVRAQHRGHRSRIWLTNASAKLAVAYENERAEVTAACDAREAAREASAADREKRLREKARKFEEDLRPPLEVPKE